MLLQWTFELLSAQALRPGRIEELMHGARTAESADRETQL